MRLLDTFQFPKGLAQEFPGADGEHGPGSPFPSPSQWRRAHTEVRARARLRAPPRVDRISPRAHDQRAFLFAFLNSVFSESWREPGAVMSLYKQREGWGRKLHWSEPGGGGGLVGGWGWRGRYF